jgi:hypothetical protein
MRRRPADYLSEEQKIQSLIEQYVNSTASHYGVGETPATLLSHQTMQQFFGNTNSTDFFAKATSQHVNSLFAAATGQTAGLLGPDL